jgi:hypothetical protein
VLQHQGLDPDYQGVETHTARQPYWPAEQITAADPLRVELRDPNDFSATILIIWPQMPSVVDPRRFGTIANAVVEVLKTVALQRMHANQTR